MPDSDLKLYTPANVAVRPPTETDGGPGQDAKKAVPVGVIIGALIAVVIVGVGFSVLGGTGPGDGAAGFRKVSRTQADAPAATAPTSPAANRRELAALPGSQSVATPFDSGAASATSALSAGPSTTASVTAQSAVTAPTATSPAAKPVPSAVPADPFQPASASFVVSMTASPVPGGAQLTWTVSGPVAQLGGFDLEWSCCGLGQGSMQLPATARSQVISNLQAGTAYQARIVARLVDGGVDDASAHTVAFTTPGDPPTTSTAVTRPSEPTQVPSTTAVTKPVTTTTVRTKPRVTLPPRREPQLPSNPIAGLLTGASGDDETAGTTNSSATTATTTATTVGGAGATSAR